MKQFLILGLIFPVLLHAEDITLSDGKVYKDAKIVNHDAVNATILYDNGGATIPIEKMDPVFKKQLGYDPVKAKLQMEIDASQAARKAENQQEERDLATSAVPASGKITQVLANGILADLIAPMPDWVSPSIVTVEHFVTAQYPQGHAFYSTNAPISEHQFKSLGSVFVACPTVGLVDDQNWAGTIWKIGTYSFIDTQGAQRTVEKYTASSVEAAEFLKAQH